MIYIIYSIIISYSFGNSISCSKVPLYLNLQKNTLYIYKNTISITTWPKKHKIKVKHQGNSFRSLLYPLKLRSDGYDVYEVITDAKNNTLLQLIGKPPAKLPNIYFYPFYPIGQIGKNSNKPVPIKYIKCEDVFKTTEEIHSFDKQLTLIKESVNKVTSIKRKKVMGKKVSLINIVAKKEVTLKGRMEGRGTETSVLSLIAKTREPYEEIRTFRYEYRIGEGKDRYTEIMEGKYRRRLFKKKKYKKPKSYLSKTSDKKNTVRYFTNKNGLFIPVVLNKVMNTKMFVDPTHGSSYIDFVYYDQNFTQKPKDYFYPFEKLDIGKNIVSFPGIEIVKADPDKKIDYKIPGTIGNSIIAKGTIIVNDKNRTFSFFKSKKAEIPQKAILFNLVDNIPIFEIMINNSPAHTTISFDTREPQISRKLQRRLKLKTILLASSKNKPEENIIEKTTDIIISPLDRKYFKTRAIVKEFHDAPYDLKLGLRYIKNKELTINYIDKWILIQ